ncbi:retroviral-like aspartic protease family protein [Acetobacter syzygii]|uniref:retroviral-like aspartic protease family protein n=1 Tax=Acetobacter syzygii TaxID=146476 RepID=UPI0020C6ACFD|nr:retroviral-like aspartic protease family protein [Acetobacter syzygii]
MNFLQCVQRGQTGWLMCVAVMATMVLQPHKGSAQSCHHLVARVALYNDQGFLNVPVSLNGHVARMIVDTGSEGSLLSPEAAALFGTQLDSTMHTIVHGTGGVGRIVPNAVVHSLTMAKLEFGPVSMPVDALPAVPKTEPAVEGLVGGDLLSRYDVEFDVAHGALTFWSAGSAECSGPQGWHYIYRAVPLQNAGRRVIARVELDGHALQALVDSGARSCIVSTRAAERIGVSQSTLATDPGGLTSGVDGHQQTYHWHRFGVMQIGQEQEKSPVLTVAPVQDTVDMLLGSDWFAAHRVWISYRTHTLYVMPATGRGK